MGGGWLTWIHFYCASFRYAERDDHLRIALCIDRLHNDHFWWHCVHYDTRKRLSGIRRYRGSSFCDGHHNHNYLALCRRIALHVYRTRLWNKLRNCHCGLTVSVYGLHHHHKRTVGVHHNLGKWLSRAGWYRGSGLCHGHHNHDHMALGRRCSLHKHDSGQRKSKRDCYLRLTKCFHSIHYDYLWWFSVYYYLGQRLSRSSWHG